MRSAALALACAFVLVAMPRSARGDQDPQWRWRTIETDHFRVHYHQGLEGLARRTAEAAEQIHDQLSVELGWTPRRPTHLVLVDDTDYAQGITMAGPNNVIRLWAVGPEDVSTLEDYDDWLTNLLSHEYAHLLQIDNATGFWPTLINSIFGNVYFPNAVAPHWMLEGFAIQEESTLTSGGRVRGTMFDMYMRAAVLEGRMLRIDQVSSAGIRIFPRGNAPYLYGAKFVDYVTRRFGRGVLERLAHEYGNARWYEPIPLDLNRTFSRATGHTAVELWSDFRRSLEAGYRAQADRLSEEGLTTSRRLTLQGEWMRSPRYSADGRAIYVYQSSQDQTASIWRVDPSTGRRRHLTDTSGDTAIAVGPEGRFLYYSRPDRHRVTYRYDDLFRYDLRTGREQRLTDGARAHEPDVSPDGRMVAYVAWRGESSDLWVATPEMSSKRRLVESRPGEQVYSPRFSPDGTRIAYSAWRSGGYRDIQVVDLATGSVERITDDRGIDSSPTFSPNGRYIVFTSDRTGIANVYAYDLEQRTLRQVTNVLTGAYMPEVSPDGAQLAFVGFSSIGFDLHVMPFDPESFRDPQPATERESLARTRRRVRMRDRPYSPWETLAPRSWGLSLGEDGFGSALVLSAEGHDATEAHWAASELTVGLERGDVHYDLAYVYRGAWPDISVRHARSVTPRRNFRVDTEPVPYVSETYVAQANLGITLGRGLYSHELSAGWDLRWTRAVGGLPQVDWDPSGRPPSIPSLGLESGLRVSWRFSNARGSVGSISHESGRTLGASMGLSHPAFGSDFFEVTFRYRWTEYIGIPRLRHHVLVLGLWGGISAGDRTETFSVGGYPEQDLLRALVGRFLGDDLCYGGAALRGYRPGVATGSQYHLLNVEYRLPIWDPQVGVYTLPVFLSHIWLAVFCDVGGAFAAELDVDRLLVGVGGELRVTFVLGYSVPLTLRIGYARGLMDEGEDQVLVFCGYQF